MTVAVPAALIWLAETVVVSNVELTTEETCETPFHCARHPAVKPKPVMDNVNPAPPASATLGFSPVMPLTLKTEAAEVLPPGFCTVMFVLPALAIRADPTDAVRTVDPP